VSGAVSGWILAHTENAGGLHDIQMGLKFIW